VDGETSARVPNLCARIEAVHTAPAEALDDDRPTLAASGRGSHGSAVCEAKAGVFEPGRDVRIVA
jgi:hypothetical protein